MTPSGPRFTLAVLAVAVVLLLPTLSYRMGVDQGSFAAIGAGILEGRWPYLGTWESDFPGMMFLQAAEFLVLGKSIVMFRVFDLLVQLLSALLIYRITARVGSPAAGLLAVGVYCLVYQGYGPWNTAQREGFATPLILAGFWWYFTAERRSPGRTAFGIGLGLGLAALFKPTLLALAAFYLPLLPSLSRATLPIVGVAGLGLLLPAGLVLALYAMLGGVRELVEATLSYQTIYTARLRGERGLLASWWASVPKLGLQAKAVALGALPFLFGGPRRQERVMLYLAYLGSVFAVVVQGTFAGYHYLPGLALGAILIGSGFAQVLAALRRRFAVPDRRTEVALAALLVAAALPLYVQRESLRRLASLQFLGAPAPGEFRIGTVFDFTESFELAGYLRQHTDPADAVQVWGYEPLVYFLAERFPASRFGITHPLVMRVPGRPLSAMQQRWRREFLAAVSQRKPRYVAVVQHDNWWWAPEEQTSAELLEDFPEWQRVLARDYRLETTIGRFLVYRRSEGQDPP